MFDPSWDEGCKSCSFWADNFNGIDVRLNHRDVTFVLVSRAPLATLPAYQRRTGWSIKRSRPSRFARPRASASSTRTRMALSYSMEWLRHHDRYEDRSLISGAALAPMPRRPS